VNSRRSASEAALAVRACAELRNRRRPHVLIGGLGMGFTLRAAQAELGSDARITLAELVPEVVAWARGPMADIFGDSLADPRLDIREMDVSALIASAVSTYDAILLDVDNGPAGLTRRANDQLYDARGLDAARRALCPGGVLAVWSSGADPRFTQRLRKAGFDAREDAVRAHGEGRRGRHVIWIATAGRVPARRD